MANNLIFPDITEVLYREKSFEAIQEAYITELKNEGSFYNVLYANKSIEYQNVTTDKKQLAELEMDFYELSGLLSLSGITAKILRRKKNYIGFNEKVRLFLQTGKPLSKMHDILGFRIVLGDSSFDDINSIKACYDVMSLVLNFFIYKKSCYPLESEPLLETSFSNNDFSEIIVPKESFLPENFMINVKDYIKNPKMNGYQSLHSVIHSPSGIDVEIQVRTKAMDIYANLKGARHEDYKNSKYPYRIQFDRNRIDIPGYEYKDGNVYDSVGLEKSVDPFAIVH